MKFLHYNILFFFLITFSVLLSCGGNYQKLLKSKDLVYKEKRARELYEQKKYTKRLQNYYRAF